MELITALLPFLFLVWHPEDCFPMQETSWP